MSIYEEAVTHSIQISFEVIVTRDKRQLERVQVSGDRYLQEGILRFVSQYPFALSQLLEQMTGKFRRIYEILTEMFSILLNQGAIA